MSVRLLLSVASLAIFATHAHAQQAPNTPQRIEPITTQIPDAALLRLGRLDPERVGAFDTGKIGRLDQRSQNAQKIGPIDAALPGTTRSQAREQDPYAPLGLRIGAFDVFPTLDITAIATTNARRDASEEADLGIGFKPAVRFESDWSRHSLTGSASANIIRYLRTGDASVLEGEANAALRLDLFEDTTVDASLAYTADRARAETDLAGETATGSQLSQTLDAKLSAARDFAIWRGSVGVGVSRGITGDANLASGGTDDNTDRIFTRLSLNLRGEHDGGALFRPFVGLILDRSIFDQSTDRDGLRRGATGLQGEIGVTFDDPLWTGSVSLVGGLRNFDDGSLDLGGIIGLNADVTWRPTELTDVKFTSSATLGEGTTAGVGATRNWKAGVDVTHRLRDNLDLLAGWSSEIAAGDKVDQTYGAKLGVSWDINRELALSAGYEGTIFRSGESSDENYTDHRVLTTLRLRR